MTPLSVLLDHVSAMLSQVQAVQDAGIPLSAMMRAGTPIDPGKKVITFLWIPQGRERALGEEIGRLVITVCTPEPAEAESVCCAVVDALDWEARCGNDTLTVWQFDHTGGMPTPLHNIAANTWEAEAQFKVKYG